MNDEPTATHEIADVQPTEADRALAEEAIDGATLKPRHALRESVALALAEARAVERRRIVAELVDGNGSHDCRSCDDTGALRDGRTCPLCDGFGKL